MLLGALKHELGPLRSRIGPLSRPFLFLFVIWAPPKNSGPNPMSFQFLVGVTLGPHESWHSLGKILATPLMIRGAGTTLKLGEGVSVSRGPR